VCLVSDVDAMEGGLMTKPKKKRRRNVRSFAGGSNAVRSRERRELERLADAKHHRAEALARATKLPAAQAIAIYRAEKALSEKRNAPIIADVAPRDLCCNRCGLVLTTYLPQSSTAASPSDETPEAT
jgi:hypothetical protein